MFILPRPLKLTAGARKSLLKSSDHYAGSRARIPWLARTVPYKNLSDEELLCACAASREAKLWDELFDRFLRYIATIVRRVLLAGGGDASRANMDDLVQETIIKIYDPARKVLASFEADQPGSARSFLFIVTRNLVLDDLRRYRRLNNGRVLPIGEEGVDPISLIPDRKESNAPVERDILFRELDEVLQQLDSSTAAQDRRIFWLHYRQGMSAREISELPWVRIGTKGVESSLFKTTKRIRSALSGSRPPGESDRKEGER
jgi:RNA polymerase sigma-70 factor, ECF subfamily